MQYMFWKCEFFYGILKSEHSVLIALLRISQFQIEITQGKSDTVQCTDKEIFPH